MKHGSHQLKMSERKCHKCKRMKCECYKTKSKKPKEGGDWHYCNDCQLKRGGKVPKFGHRGITVMMGECTICGDKEATLVPNADYIWPGQKYFILD